jgi:hypothetical protein
VSASGRGSDRNLSGDRADPETQVGALIQDLLVEYNLSDEVRRHRVCTEWLDIVGPRNAARTWPSPIHDGVLWVRVSNSSWLHELSFLRDDIRARVNAHLGDPPLVEEVRLHLGRRQRRGDEDCEPRTASRFRVHRRRRHMPPPATGARLAAIEAETESIEDEELRAIVREARRRLGQ